MWLNGSEVQWKWSSWIHTTKKLGTRVVSCNNINFPTQRTSVKLPVWESSGANLTFSMVKRHCFSFHKGPCINSAMKHKALYQHICLHREFIIKVKEKELNEINILRHIIACFLSSAFVVVSLVYFQLWSTRFFCWFHHVINSHTLKNSSSEKKQQTYICICEFQIFFLFFYNIHKVTRQFILVVNQLMEVLIVNEIFTSNMMYNCIKKYFYMCTWRLNYWENKMDKQTEWLVFCPRNKAVKIALSWNY